LIDPEIHADPRGRLVAFEEGRSLPFAPVRFFLIHDVPRWASRANHTASCNQYLVAVIGACTLAFQSEDASGEYRLNASGQGVLVPEGCFIRLVDFEPGTVLAAACDRKYTPRTPA
jgi:hypothetical protein